ncbi:MAG TPA: phosphate signaling complex protein PhoU [Bacteroidota bacterium]
MERRFEKDLESLKTTLIRMGSVVEEHCKLAINAVLEEDVTVARKVIDTDERINSLEIEMDNAVIDILALQQPVASDLRLILAAQKISNDLERIGDHAVNIAEAALQLAKIRPQEPRLEIPKMAEIATAMLRDALDSFVHVSPELAQAVLKRDDLIDDLNRSMTMEVVQLLQKNKKLIEGGLEIIRVSRNLERIGDLATNIAEEVIFLAQARIVKHHAADKKVQPENDASRPPGS